MILFTGRGTSGSWQIRGVQIGQTLVAKVQPKTPDLSDVDLAVIVKRVPDDLLEKIRRRGVPVVWDIVDAWPQPIGNEWTERQAKDWLYAQIDRIRPIGIVSATQQMGVDCGADIPVLALPHHSRPGLDINPIRDCVKRIGYEGSLKHLGKWEHFYRSECKHRGWEFVPNPESMTDVDIVIAARELHGYAPRHWKSNVKLANPQGSGTPCIMPRECGYLETQSGGELWADTMEEARHALDVLTDKQERLARAKLLRSADISLQSLSKRYRKWLSQLKY
jgi:hypothetical protein